MIPERSLLQALCALLLSVGVAPAASAQYFDNRPAQQPRSAPTYSTPIPGTASGHNHDSGFLLRFSGGIGYASTRTELDAGRTDFRGGTLDYNIAVGGIAFPNFGIHATLFGWTMPQPEFYFQSQRIPGDLTRSFLTAVGPGITYYLGDSNVYVTGSGGLAFATLDGGGYAFPTDSGFALDIGVGKEWWVGPQWGVGIAAGFMFHSIGNGIGDESWTGTSVGLRFSATFN